MGFRARLRASAAIAVVAAVCVATPLLATRSELSEAEVAQLYAGHAVVREETVQRQGHRYIGGVSYILIDSPPAEVMAVLDDVNAYRHILPKTRIGSLGGHVAPRGGLAGRARAGDQPFARQVHRSLAPRPFDPGPHLGDASLPLGRPLSARHQRCQRILPGRTSGDRTLLTYLVKRSTSDRGSLRDCSRIGCAARRYRRRARQELRRAPRQPLSRPTWAGAEG